MQLRNFRLEHNLTQKQLALLLGVSPGAIEKREQAGTVPEQMLLSLAHISRLLLIDSCRDNFSLLLNRIETNKKLVREILRGKTIVWSHYRNYHFCGVILNWWDNSPNIQKITNP